VKVKALRGVCIGVGQHLKAGDIEDLEPALVTYLVGIGAVERVPDEPPKPDPVVAEPVKPEPPKDETPKSAPAKSGSKEK
jgi:hypothetical protein